MPRSRAPLPAAPDGPVEHILLAWLESNSVRRPDKVFVHSIDQNKAITYRQAWLAVGRIVGEMAARGLRPNDRVALLANNSIEHLLVYLGVMVHGATVCTIHVEMNAAHFKDILGALDARLVLFEEGLDLERLQGAAGGEWIPLGVWRSDGGEGFFADIAHHGDRRPPVSLNGWGDIASIFYTSGTAARPKGVVCTFAELIENIEPTAGAFGIAEPDRVLDFRSYNWMSAQVLSFLGVLCKGATLYMARRFSQSRYFDWIRDFEITIGVCNPTAINMFINRPVAVSAADVPHLRFLTSSSAPLMVADWKVFEEMYAIPIAQGYGSSETGWIAGSNERTRRIGTVGKPHAYQNLTVVDDAGRPLPPGAIGAIEIGRAPDNEFRYLAEDGTLHINAKGRARTGDLGCLDAEGYLRITGRTKELIIRGGVNIAPAEIDNLVLGMAEVAEAAALGVPDPIYGQEVVVYVAVKPGAALIGAAVLAHCRAVLPHAKMPKQVVFRDALPKTDRGKLDRNALAADWQARCAAGSRDGEPP